MSTALRLPTLDTYLAADAADERKLEFVDGEIVAMAGGDPLHSRIAQKLGAALERRLGGAPCLTFQSDLRVCVGDEDTYVYPDVTLAGPPRRYLDTDPRTLATPTIVFEVLSPSTAAHDQGPKAAAYRRTASLREYVFIDTESRHVVHVVRKNEHEWTLRDYTGDDVMPLPAAGIELPLAEIYEGFEALHDELRAAAAPETVAAGG